MIVTPVHCVVDASVAITSVIHEADSRFAHDLFEHLDKDKAVRFHGA